MPHRPRDHGITSARRPGPALPATQPGYAMLVQRTGADRAVVIDLMARGNRYDVRLAHVLEPVKWRRRLKRLGGGAALRDSGRPP